MGRKRFFNQLTRRRKKGEKDLFNIFLNVLCGLSPTPHKHDPPLPTPPLRNNAVPPFFPHTIIYLFVYILFKLATFPRLSASLKRCPPILNEKLSANLYDWDEKSFYLFCTLDDELTFLSSSKAVTHPQLTTSSISLCIIFLDNSSVYARLATFSLATRIKC